jgi:hypothetical protein
VEAADILVEPALVEETAAAVSVVANSVVSAVVTLAVPA